MFLTQRLRVLQRFHRVERFTRLRDRHNELARISNHLAVTVFRSDFDVARQVGDRLDPILRGQTCVVGRAASKNFHAVDIRKNFRRTRTKQLRTETVVINNCFNRVSDGAWLFVDFFLHEVLVRAQFERRQRDVRDVHFAFNHLIVAIKHHDTFARDFSRITFFEEDDATGRLQNCGDVGGDEVFVFAETDEQRTAHARGDQAVWFFL